LPTGIDPVTVLNRLRFEKEMADEGSRVASDTFTHSTGGPATAPPVSTASTDRSLATASNPGILRRAPMTSMA